MTYCTKCGFAMPSLVANNGPDADAINDQPTFPSIPPKLRELDIEISCMDAIINDLLEKRAAKTRIRNQYTRISCLPSEILTEIFVATLDSDSLILVDDVAHTTSMPMILGKVCSEWRTIAWDLSTLWTSVHCRVSTKKVAAQAAVLSEWLSRSNHRPLTIRITFEYENAWTSPNASTAIMDALVLHCHQWQNVALVLPEAWYDSLAPVAGKFQCLETLFIRPPGLAFVPGFIDVFSDASKLREVHISHYYLHHLSFPWDQLTIVTLGTASTDEALELINRCPNLLSCRFVDLNPPEDQFPVEYVHNSTLQSLSIALDEFTPLDAILETLTLPSLRQLSLTLPKIHHNPVPIIEALIYRSSCPLKAVDVIGPDITEQDIIIFLTNSPTVSQMTNNV